MLDSLAQLTTFGVEHMLFLQSLASQFLLIVMLHLSSTFLIAVISHTDQLRIEISNLILPHFKMASASISTVSMVPEVALRTSSSPPSRKVARESSTSSTRSKMSQNKCGSSTKIPELFIIPPIQILELMPPELMASSLSPPEAQVQLRAISTGSCLIRCSQVRDILGL